MRVSYIAKSRARGHVPSVLVALILCPFIPYLSVSIDSTFIVPIQNVILTLDNPSQSEILEFEWDPILDPVIDIVRERDPTMHIKDGIVQFDL